MYWRLMQSFPPTQGRIWRAWPARAFVRIRGSAMYARAMPTTSAWPSAKTRSATSIEFTRPV